MSDPRLMDIEPGGESTQYESIVEFTVPPPRQIGQLGGDSEIHAVPEKSDPFTEEDDDTLAQKLGRGVLDHSEEDLDSDAAADAAVIRARKQQGYGPDPNLGA